MAASKSKVLLCDWLPFEAELDSSSQSEGKGLGILVELVQSIEAAQPWTRIPSLGPVARLQTLDCHGLVLDVHEGNLVHVVLVVGNFHATSERG